MNSPYEIFVRMIVRKHGGYREKEIFNNPHIIEESETWNKHHKVLNILSVEPDTDGYRSGFQADIVTKSIVG